MALGVWDGRGGMQGMGAGGAGLGFVVGYAACRWVGGDLGWACGVGRVVVSSRL